LTGARLRCRRDRRCPAATSNHRKGHRRSKQQPYATPLELNKAMQEALRAAEAKRR